MNKQTIASRIKKIRELRKISAPELAERSGIAAKQLEDIENGNQIPSLGPLIRVARALGVRLGTFTDDQETLGPVVTKAGTGAQGISFSSGSSSSHEHMDFFSMAQDKAGRHMEPFIVEIKPNEPGKSILSSHEGEEFVYVLNGQIEISYGKDSFTLSKGDSIYYDSIVKHHVHALGKETATLLAVVYVPL